MNKPSENRSDDVFNSVSLIWPNINTVCFKGIQTAQENTLCSEGKKLACTVTVHSHTVSSLRSSLLKGKWNGMYFIKTKEITAPIFRWKRPYWWYTPIHYSTVYILYIYTVHTVHYTYTHPYIQIEHLLERWELFISLSKRILGQGGLKI